MALTRPLHTLSSPLNKQTIPSLINSHKSNSISFTFSSSSSSCLRQVAASVSFNPSGNYDLSLYDDQESKQILHFHLHICCNQNLKFISTELIINSLLSSQLNI